MELFQLMKNRRSIRKYTGERISPEALEKIVNAALLAPSSKNIRPVELVIVEDRDALTKLSKSKAAGADALKDAAAAVVVLADTRKASAWVEDCSIAMTYMMLMAEELGIANCWIQERLRVSAEGKDSALCVKEQLGIPDYCEVDAILALGYAEKKEEPRKWDETEQHKIHREVFQRKEINQND